MPKCKLHYLLRMQITRSTKVQIWWDWVAKAINLSPLSSFFLNEKSSGWPTRLFCPLAVTFCSSHTVCLEVYKHARLALVLELYLSCSFYMKSSLLHLDILLNHSL